MRRKELANLSLAHAYLLTRVQYHLRCMKIEGFNKHNPGTRACFGNKKLCELGVNYLIVVFRVMLACSFMG